jgi:hypothetical protein
MVRYWASLGWAWVGSELQDKRKGSRRKRERRQVRTGFVCRRFFTRRKSNLFYNVPGR